MGMVNKVKSLGARATMGDEDIRSRLETDHDRFKELVGQMCETRQASRRQALLGELKPLVTAHARAEERTAYDALLKARAGQPPHTLAQEGYVEHALVDDLFAKMQNVSADTDAWLAHARVLRELLTTHIAEEESETFAELGAHFSRDELDTMGARFEREKTSVLERGSPRQRNVASRLALERRSHRVPRRKTAKKAAPKRASPAANRRGARASAARVATNTRRKTPGRRTG